MSSPGRAGWASWDPTGPVGHQAAAEDHGQPGAECCWYSVRTVTMAWCSWSCEPFVPHSEQVVPKAALTHMKAQPNYFLLLSGSRWFCFLTWAKLSVWGCVVLILWPSYLLLLSSLFQLNLANFISQALTARNPTQSSVALVLAQGDSWDYSHQKALLGEQGTHCWRLVARSLSSSRMAFSIGSLFLRHGASSLCTSHQPIEHNL